MVIQLPTPIRGNTHIRLDEAVFQIKDKRIYVRGTLGKGADAAFQPDPDMRTAYVEFTGSKYNQHAAAAATPAFITDLHTATWGFTNG
jgi:hypothetical protein